MPHIILCSQTRVLVTHGIHYLPETDLVVVLDDGNIAECAPYQELIDKKGEFSDFVLQHLNDGKVETTGTPSGPGSPVSENPTNGHGILILHCFCFFKYTYILFVHYFYLFYELGVTSSHAYD